MRVAVHQPPGGEEFVDRKSTTLVLHLHGSLCIRTSEFQVRLERGHGIALLSEREEPLYAFDPSSISANFSPFDRVVGGDDVEDRIIAAVPNKSRGLKQAFVRETFRRALALVRNSDLIVVIGYSFNHHDRASFQPLLEALGESKGRKLLLISPDSHAVAKTIRACFPDMRVEPLKATFKQWVAASFPGVETQC